MVQAASACSASTTTHGCRATCAQPSAEMVDPALWHLENVWRKSYRIDGAPNAPETYAEFDWMPTWDRNDPLIRPADRELYDQ